MIVLNDKFSCLLYLDFESLVYILSNLSLPEPIEIGRSKTSGDELHIILRSRYDVIQEELTYSTINNCVIAASEGWLDDISEFIDGELTPDLFVISKNGENFIERQLNEPICLPRDISHTEQFKMASGEYNIILNNIKGLLET